MFYRRRLDAAHMTTDSNYSAYDKGSWSVANAPSKLWRKCLYRRASLAPISPCWRRGVSVESLRGKNCQNRGGCYERNTWEGDFWREVDPARFSRGAPRQCRHTWSCAAKTARYNLLDPLAWLMIRRLAVRNFSRIWPLPRPLTIAPRTRLFGYACLWLGSPKPLHLLASCVGKRTTTCAIFDAGCISRWPC